MSATQFAAFERSAELYDLFHAEKDYDSEAHVYLHNLQNPRSILEIGAGTGEFTKRFAKHCEVYPVEPNKRMADLCEQKTGLRVLRRRWDELRSISPADAPCTDSICAPYTVLSYATVDPSLIRHCLSIAYARLLEHGVFVFDVVNYGGAPVSSRVFTKEAGDWRQTFRKKLNPHTSILSVKATFENLKTGERFQEDHQLRAFTPAEITSHLERAGFRNIRCFPYCSDSDSIYVGMYDLYFMVVAEA